MGEADGGETETTLTLRTETTGFTARYAPFVACEASRAPARLPQAERNAPAGAAQRDRGRGGARDRVQSPAGKVCPGAEAPAFDALLGRTRRIGAPSGTPAT
jgi:hypothetical protein